MLKQTKSFEIMPLSAISRVCWCHKNFDDKTTFWIVTADRKLCHEYFDSESETSESDVSDGYETEGTSTDEDGESENDTISEDSSLSSLPD